MPDDSLEVKIGSKWAKSIVPLVTALVGIGGGGAAGTWLAPQASAQDIREAATTAAERAIESERRVTDQRFLTVDAKLNAQKETLDDLKEGQTRQDDKLNRILDRVSR